MKWREEEGIIWLSDLEISNFYCLSSINYCLEIFFLRFLNSFRFRLWFHFRFDRIKFDCILHFEEKECEFFTNSYFFLLAIKLKRFSPLPAENSRIDRRRDRWKMWDKHFPLFSLSSISSIGSVLNLFQFFHFHFFHILFTNLKFYPISFIPSFSFSPLSSPLTPSRFSPFQQ